MDDELKRLYLRVRIWFDIRGYDQEAEDAAQDYVVAVLEGRAGKQTIVHYCIDYLRKRSGRPSSSTHATRRGVAAASELEQTRHEPSLAYDPREHIDEHIYFREFILGIKDHRARGVIELYLAGFSFAEIGKRLRCSEARAHQLYHRTIKKRLRAIKAKGRCKD